MNKLFQMILYFCCAFSFWVSRVQAEGELTGPQPPLVIQGDAVHSEVKCRLAGGWLIVPVEVDGVQGWFKLATGWGQSHVDRKFIQKAKLRSLPRRGILENASRRSGQPTCDFQFVRGGRFCCGEASAECVWLGIGDFGDLSRRAKLSIDGVLGWDFLRHACFTIDYTVPSVTWHRSGSFKASGQAEKLVLRNGANYPIVQCGVNHANAWAMINTATQILDVTQEFANQNHGEFCIPRSGINSSQMSWRKDSPDSPDDCKLIAQYPRAWIWNRRVPLSLGNVRQEISARLDLELQPEDCDVCMGYALLRNFRVTFDGPGGAIWLQHASITPELAAVQLSKKALGSVDLNVAVACDDVEAVITSLKNGNSIVDGKWENGDATLLSRSLGWGAKKCANALIEVGIPVEPHGILTEDTPLQIAADLGDVVLIKRLLKAGADPRRKFMGFDALAHAAGSGSMDAVQALMPRSGLTIDDAAKSLPYAAWGGNTRILEFFAKPLSATLDVSRLFSNGLNESCLFGHVDAARWHLSHGAEANGNSELPITPLLATLIPGPPEKNDKVKRELIELLLQAGANPNMTRKGVSPMLMAAEFGDADAIQLLLKANGKASGTDNRGFGTMAWAARGRQSADVVTLLLDAGVEVDRMDANDQTPLMAFAQLGDIASCKVLLDAGADVNAAAMMSATAITLASNSFLCWEEDAAAMVSFLKSRGAKMNSAKHEIDGPLVGAIGSGRAAVVESAIKAGGDPNQEFAAGLRPLHLAAAMSNRAVASKLIELGADPKALDKSSVGVLCHAAAAGRTDIISLLLVKGHPPDGPDGSVSPLGMAVGAGQLAAVRQLLAAGANPNASYGKSGKSILQASKGDDLIREALIAAGAREE